MENKYTPPPWRYQSYDYGVTIYGKYGAWVAEVKDTPFAYIPLSFSINNAQLISASPDLLEFVKKVSESNIESIYNPEGALLKHEAKKLLRRLETDFYRRKR